MFENLLGLSHAEPTKGEMLAEKYERRFNRATSAKNGAAAFAVANDIAYKLAEAAESCAAGGDPMSFLHRYDQGFSVIGYAKDTLRIDAALATIRAADALQNSPDARMRMTAVGLKRWAMGLKSSGANDATAAMINPGKMFGAQPRSFGAYNAAPAKWPAQTGGKPHALREFQQDLVEA